ncbi:hypothetical protein PsYK624_012450 [Phanerochaete sordida]|uniref:Uncharacterized protein n=1 Tax=Phanerochaete sordida TaxID=48140 RepID=A0A9P3L8Y8_9APHY|nr:hypothetical protein PsYK624_012450 [Phanerochaete sordida]
MQASFPDASAVQRKTLITREISVVGAASFAIAGIVGFIGFLVICVAFSSCYRRRIARHEADLLARVTTHKDAGRPQLWDIYLPGLEKTSEGRASTDWEQLLPLAMKVQTNSGKLIRTPLTLRQMPLVRPGCSVAAWFRPWPSRYPSRLAAADLTAAEVAILVAMPSPPAVCRRQAPLDIRTECAVGTSMLPYHRKSDPSIRRVIA